MFVRRPTLVMVFCALITLAGVIAGTHLVEQQFPNGDVPTIQVLVNYSGASTSEMRDAIVRPLEDQLAGAPSLQDLETAIQPGQATIVSRFALNSDVNTDLVQVQGRVQNAQRQLPSDLQTPTISIYDPSQAVVVSLIASSSTLSSGELSSMVTNRIVPAIEQLPGISFVIPNGNVTPAIAVSVDPRRLGASGETLTDVVNAITQNNVRAPGGIVYGADRETNIDIRGDIQTPADVSGLLLGSGGSSPAGTDVWSGDAQLLSIANVASVTSGYEPQRVYAYAHGQDSITLDIQKAGNSSEIQAAHAVLAQLPLLARDYPDVTLRVLNVQATYTEQQLSGVAKTLMEAIFFTAIVMLFFLRSWRNAIVVMIAIPTSLLVTLAAMKLANFTLDTVSLLAMTLIIGILVDDSIVVLENIERHAHQGEDPETAAIRGRLEIGAAAVVITLVDVVVFLPLSFLPGSVGVFLREFGLVVTVATMTSLLVSFTITPALAGRWSLLSRWRPWPLIDAFTRRFDATRTWYVERILPWALRRPIAVCALCFGSLLLAITLVPLGLVGTEYIPAVDRGEFFLTIAYPEGTPLETTRLGTLAVEKAADAIPDLQSETALVGSYQGNLSGYINDGAIGQVHIFLKSTRRNSTSAWAARLQREAQHIVPHAHVTAVPATSTNGGIQQPIDEVVSADVGDPEDAAQQVFAALGKTPGALDVTTTGGLLSPQVEVRFDRDRARALGASVGTASTAIRSAFGGDVATQFIGSNGLQDVQVIYPAGDREQLTAVAAIPIRSGGGSTIHVGDIASLALAPAPPLITRIDRRTVAYVGANVAPGAELSNVQRDFNKRIAALNLPSTIHVAPIAGGNQESVTDTVVGMSISLLLSIALVYLLMVALYDSYRTPFVIMFSVPVAVVGAVGALALTYQTLNLFSFIGSILLVGLVTKNGILLVDFADRLSAQGLSREEAVRESAKERFRPIVMTTLAMIAGMLPLALALDPGAVAARSLGTVVIGGLTSSLILTLLLVPTIALRVKPPHRELSEQAPLPSEVGGASQT
jgi:HAE1 family hydrophobic/amphiphilic exporter-1